jgi:hypothetical protein
VARAGDDPAAAVAQAYRAFARLEARGRSAAYESLAESVTDDATLTSFLASLPSAKRQPNLLFAAARYLLGAPPSHGTWLHWLPPSGRQTSRLSREFIQRTLCLPEVPVEHMVSLIGDIDRGSSRCPAPGRSGLGS